MWTVFFRNGHLLWITVIVLLVAGISALRALPRLEDPRMANRNPIVVAPFPGASPERVEALLTEKLEEALQEVPEIKELESQSRAGVATIAIELVDEVDDSTNDAVFSEIRDRLSTVKLPIGADAPIFDDQRGAVAFTFIQAFVWTSDTPPQLGILRRHAKDLADRLRTLPGTELVRLYGVSKEELTVLVDRTKLATLGLSPSDVAQAIADADTKKPAGQVRGVGADIPLEVRGQVDTVSRMQTIPVRSGNGGSVVRVSDVAEVQRRWESPVTEIALADQRRAIFVAARVKPGQRVDRWADSARGIADDCRGEVGGGVSLVTTFDQSRYTEERLGSLAGNLLAGAVVIMSVVLVIMGWRSALLVGSALPLVSGATLFLLLVSGGSLHQMSVFGMIIALGLLIDNAIVVVDEVRKSRLRGNGRSDAVRETLRHLAAPLLASTLTTIFAFAPIVLLPGNIGDFVGAIGTSVILAVGCSLIVALTVIAALAGRYGPASLDPRGRRWWRDGVNPGPAAPIYRQVLLRSLRYPLLAMSLAALPAAAGFLLFGQLGNQFFPRVDRNMFQAELWLPPESSIANTRHVAAQVETKLREEQEVRGVHWLIGGSAPSVYYNLVMNQDQAAHYAQAVITTDSASSVKPLLRRLQPKLDREFPQAQIVVTQFAQGPPVEAPVQFRLYGPSVQELQRLGDRLRLALQRHEQVLHTQVTMPRGKPKLWVDINQDAARLAGLSLSEVAGQLEGSFQGAVGGSLLEETEELDVRVRMPDVLRSSFEAVLSTPLVRSAAGGWVPLASLGDLKLLPEIGGIGRKDGQRCNTIKGYVTNDALPIEITEQVLRRVKADGLVLPPGYRLELGGDAEAEDAAVASLAKYLPLLATLTAATLVLVFRSVALSLLLGTVAGLSIGLGLMSTWLFGFPFSFNTILGSLGLIGVALNDSIVVLAAIRGNTLARNGDLEAIVDEVSGCTRHILSTTLTTAGGFVPLILAGGDFWPPLAVVIAGGVLGATLIALGYVPAGYVLHLRLKCFAASFLTAGVNKSPDDRCVIPANRELDRGQIAEAI